MNSIVLQGKIATKYLLSYSDGKSVTRLVKVPDSITKWSIYGLAQCCATGFCVSEPVELTVFQPLFVECHLPYSFKRQEQVSVECSAYNYNANDQWVNVISIQTLFNRVMRLLLSGKFANYRST